MYLIDALKVLVRQWLIVVCGLLCIAGASVGVVMLVPTQHQATGQLVLLLPPNATGESSPTNPYLHLPAGLTTTASLVASTLMTKDSQLTMFRSGFESEYDVAVVPGAGPVLIIMTKDTDAARALATRDEVMQRLMSELVTIQQAADVPQRQLISGTPMSVGSVAEALPGSKIRALAVVCGSGALLTLLAAFMVDRRGRRRLGSVRLEPADASAA